MKNKHNASAKSSNSHITYPSIQLRKALERNIAHGHPWIFREALTVCQWPAGTLVDVLDQRGRFIARGLVEAGPIAVRILTLKQQPIDQKFWQERIIKALVSRDQLVQPPTNALRLINGEGDQLPGLVIDRYGSYAIVVYDGEAMQTRQQELFSILEPQLKKRGIDHILLREGRGPTRSLCPLCGSLPPDKISVQEHSMKLLVDLLHGQKTGPFLDHRESRLAILKLCLGLCKPRVLNLFGYTGGFSVAAGLGGAVEVVTVDLSRPALQLAEENWLANSLDPARHTTFCGQVENYLTKYSGSPFDVVIADPPSFAPNEKAVANALKAYRAMHVGALAQVKSGGYYLAASCSSHVQRSAFETSLKEAAHQKHLGLQVFGRWSAGLDHPVPLGFAQGEYLTAVFCRVWSS